ncbi:sperm-associated antigen 1-like [Centruroides sculpturatus]|uniref:sperm-associated antigen 1-like n=1 Tax=Centruroides sculpturatus TaxID=218467 RepID=UPI000C6DFF97|nr:sperm-associated antigen 1-like [Centruroides sculpturatus]
MTSCNKKRTLLEKFSIPIEHLDFKYIESCSDVVEISRILRILRSGEEGFYPQLTERCEQRLQQLDPKNKLLRHLTPACHSSELPIDQKESLLRDLEKSIDQMKILEGELRKHNQDLWELPDIRRAEAVINPKNKENASKIKKIKPSTYAEWDRFDVQEELDKLDNEKPHSTVAKSKIGLAVDGWDASREERSLIAEHERLKGNEAYAAGDYEEAKLYYDRSLSAVLDPVTLNNRAQTYIKMKNYNAAVEDCNQVLLHEPKNIKALLRRGTAYKCNLNYEDSLKDFESALELEPNNQMAQKSVLEMRKNLLQNKQEQKTRLLIEEI